MRPYSVLELREEVAPETVEFARFLECVVFGQSSNLSKLKGDLLFDEIVGCFYVTWHMASRVQGVFR